MEHQETPVNFDFINQQPDPLPEKKRDKRTMLLIGLVVILSIILISTVIFSLFGSNKTDKLGNDTNIYVTNFLNDIKQNNFDSAYNKLFEKTRPERELFENGASFLRDKMNIDSCKLSNGAVLDGSTVITSVCGLTSSNGSITIRYVVLQSNDGPRIVEYKITEVNGETVNL